MGEEMATWKALAVTTATGQRGTTRQGWRSALGIFLVTWIFSLMRITGNYTLQQRRRRSQPVTRWQKLSGATREVTAPVEEVAEVAKERLPFMECGVCEEDFPLTVDNAIVTKFLEDPEMDYILAQCECGMWNRNFVSSSTLEMLMSRGIPLIQERFAPPEVVGSYLVVTNTPLITAHDLSPSEEHLVQYFHWVLARGDQS